MLPILSVETPSKWIYTTFNYVPNFSRFILDNQNILKVALTFETYYGNYQNELTWTTSAAITLALIIIEHIGSAIYDIPLSSMNIGMSDRMDYLDIDDITSETLLAIFFVNLLETLNLQGHQIRVIVLEMGHLPVLLCAVNRSNPFSDTKDIEISDVYSMIQSVIQSNTLKEHTGNSDLEIKLIVSHRGIS